jgi:Mn-dependent DtxR family transcriptional regulator
METEKIILETLKKNVHPLKSAEIASLAGIDKKEVDKSLKELQKNGKVTSPKRCFYSVKK